VAAESTKTLEPALNTKLAGLLINKLPPVFTTILPGFAKLVKLKVALISFTMKVSTLVCAGVSGDHAPPEKVKVVANPTKLEMERVRIRIILIEVFIKVALVKLSLSVPQK
jgi:hypothetical protein